MVRMLTAPVATAGAGQQCPFQPHGHGPMPEVLDWQRGDPRLALQRAVQELAAGKLVVFPTETGYHVAASALQPEALAALGQTAVAEDAALAGRSVGEAGRWGPWRR